MRHDEAKLQSEIVKAYHAAGVFCHSVPNEAAGTNAVRQGQFVSMGLKPGVADLVAWLPDGIAYVEVKTPTGKQSAAQERFQARCKTYGVPYHVVRSVPEAMDLIRSQTHEKGT